MSNKVTRGLTFLRKYGLKETISTTIRYFAIHRRFLLPRDTAYEEYLAQVVPTEEKLEAERAEVFKYNPLFSVLVPLYETDLKFLDELIKSIKAQTYSNWELCFSDGSRDKERLRTVIAEYQAADERIKYIGEGENTLGISSNTNQAFTIATGDYIILGDHDDLFMPNAFYECAKALNQDPTIDVIYTDEDKTDEGGVKHFEPSLKPDFNPDLLQSCNYITHMFVAKKSLAEEAGLFDDEYNGAQDYDFIFRCTEKAANIHHIPKVLYSWRVNATSTAGNVEAKLYAYDAGMKAVQAHYDRIGIKTVVSQDERLYGHYITQYEMPEDASLTIIVITDGFDSNLKKCTESFSKKSSFKNISFLPFNPGNRRDTTLADALNDQIDRVKSEYIMIVTCDARLYSSFAIRDMMSILYSRPDVGIVAPQFALPLYRTKHAGIIYGKDDMFGYEYLMHEDYDEEYNQYVDYMAVHSGCIMTTKSMLAMVHGFTRDYKTLESMIQDYCFKLRTDGFKSVYAGRSICKYSGHPVPPDNYKEMEAADQRRFENTWKETLSAGDIYYGNRL